MGSDDGLNATHIARLGARIVIDDVTIVGTRGGAWGDLARAVQSLRLFGT